MDLTAYHNTLGAQLATDGIPLQYGDLQQEYLAALNAAVLLDRSHEGRVRLRGSSRHELLNRMSTNSLLQMQPDEGRPTVFTNANARILERILAYNRDDHLLLITEPGRGASFSAWLQRHIFYNDDASVQDVTPETAQFALHGPQADAILSALIPQAAQVPPLYGLAVDIAGQPVYAARRKPVVGAHWLLTTSRDHASALHQTLMRAGAEQGLLAAGSLTYNTLRIRAGRPAGRELSSDYLPLEVGLWDEVSFSKGCYTGQEIIARMESRERLARTIVALATDAHVASPAPVYAGQQVVGKQTSSVQAPDGTNFAMAVLKTAFTRPGTQLAVGDGRVAAQVMHLLGAQPAYIHSIQEQTTG